MTPQSDWRVHRWSDDTLSVWTDSDASLGRYNAATSAAAAAAAAAR